MVKNIVILGAAGRDFHNFNVVYRDDAAARVVAFTATQIPGIDGRRYPPELAGPHYPDGIPIVEEKELEALCRRFTVDQVVFAYSDVTNEHVMHLAARSLALGADFTLLGPRSTMLASKLKVIAVTAVRTGCGKSALSRWLARHLRDRGWRVAVLRHPMPYGDIARERVQRFATAADLEAARCTIEEREEYEPHLEAGNLVFAGVDYAAILRAAEAEADIIVWDGGNNDFPFVRPDLSITVVDALRPLNITTHHPGEAVARMADIVVINKVDAAPPENIAAAARFAHEVNPAAAIVQAASPISLDDAIELKGRRVLAVDDGPTITHGGMPHGAAYAAAVAAGATIVDPRPQASPAFRRLFEQYPHIGRVLPAVGYSDAQLAELEATLIAADADIVVSGTPVDLGRRLRLDKPLVRARYAFKEVGEPKLSTLVDDFLDRIR